MNERLFSLFVRVLPWMGVGALLDHLTHGPGRTLAAIIGIAVLLVLLGVLGVVFAFPTSYRHAHETRLSEFDFDPTMARDPLLIHVTDRELAYFRPNDLLRVEYGAHGTRALFRNGRCLSRDVHGFPRHPSLTSRPPLGS